MQEPIEQKEPEENKHIIKNWQPLEFDIDNNYNYVSKNIIFLLFSNLLYYAIAFPILTMLTKIIYDLKIEGKENIRKLEGGAITISNHVLVLDCALVGLASGLKRIYYTTMEDNFKIPLVRRLIKLLRAIPIPKRLSNKKRFLSEVNNLIKNGCIVHFYPETAMWPYCDKIRSFKNGAFTFAVENNVPIIPILIKFREPRGIRRVFKNKKDVTLKVLKPIMPNNLQSDKKQRVEELKNEAYEEMQKNLS